MSAITYRAAKTGILLAMVAFGLVLFFLGISHGQITAEAQTPTLGEKVAEMGANQRNTMRQQETQDQLIAGLINRVSELEKDQSNLHAVITSAGAAFVVISTLFGAMMFLSGRKLVSVPVKEMTELSRRRNDDDTELDERREYATGVMHRVIEHMDDKNKSE